MQGVCPIRAYFTMYHNYYLLTTKPCAGQKSVQEKYINTYPHSGYQKSQWLIANSKK